MTDTLVDITEDKEDGELISSAHREYIETRRIRSCSPSWCDAHCGKCGRLAFSLSASASRSASVAKPLA